MVSNIQDAVKKVKASSKEKFDASIELHISLGGESVRFDVTPPHSTGKSVKIGVLASKKVPGADLELTEKDILKIESGELKPKTDFDVIIAEPKFMAKLAKAAKVLGPVGTMPNPKAGTVTEDVASAVKEFKKGKVQIKTEKDAPVIHTVIGKISFEDKKLIENFNEIYKTLLQNKPVKLKGDWIKSIYICSSMGPSVQLGL
ncbi:50S ribosomal protein L1 [bacterium]|nr:50S ribosomal protein L1 [bacterium]